MSYASYQMGIQACYDHLPRAVNQYARGSEEDLDWNDGYTDAENTLAGEYGFAEDAEDVTADEREDFDAGRSMPWMN